MSRDIIRFENVTFTYQNDDDQVIDNYSFSLPRNQILAIKGESGTGKTTLIRLILGFEQPDSGYIFYRGKPLSPSLTHQLREQTAWLPQDLNLGSGLLKDVFMFPFEFASNRTSTPDRHQIEQTFDKLDLDPSLLKNRYEELSTGQRQRVGIAICHLLNKSFLILDEPTSALDENSKQKIFDLLSGRSNYTILSTSHDPWWLKRCDQVIELAKRKEINS